MYISSPEDYISDYLSGTAFRVIAWRMTPLEGGLNIAPKTAELGIMGGHRLHTHAETSLATARDTGGDLGHNY